MIVIITNKNDFTADFLILELNRRGVEYFRFNTEEYPTNVNISWIIKNGIILGKIETNSLSIDINKINSVWYRRPGLPLINDHIVNPDDKNFAFVESKYFLDGFLKTINGFWVSSPDSIYKAENKMYQLIIANQIGFTIYPTLFTNSPIELTNFYNENQNIIYKPLRVGKIDRNGKPSGLIFTNLLSDNDKPIFNTIKNAPGIFQKKIEKSIELRITVIGNKIFPVEIHSQENEQSLIDWRKIDSENIPHIPHILPKGIEEKCITLVKQMNLQFGAIDMILTPNGEYIFLEINPNGQWAWLQQLCPKIPLRETLVDLLLQGN